MLVPEYDVSSRRPSGAVGVLMDTLLAMAQGDSSIRAALVAHSLGAMIAAGILTEYPQLPVNNVVFMAAACRVHDYLVSIVPFLERHHETQFFNLTLHPLSELQERHWLIARGSLLVWIDDFLASPAVMSDRTLGRYDNLGIASRMTPPEIRRQVHFRVFDFYNREQRGYGARGNQPRQHADFTRLPFWSEALWRPGPTDSIAAYRYGEQPRHARLHLRHHPVNREPGER
jgi:pimeloyl-ACP methyl ester carboxylesterase